MSHFDIVFGRCTDVRDGYCHVFTRHCKNGNVDFYCGQHLGFWILVVHSTFVTSGKSRSWIFCKFGKIMVKDFQNLLSIPELHYNMHHCNKNQIQSSW